MYDFVSFVTICHGNLTAHHVGGCFLKRCINVLKIKWIFEYCTKGWKKMQMMPWCRMTTVSMIWVTIKVGGWNSHHQLYPSIQSQKHGNNRQEEDAITNEIKTAPLLTLFLLESFSNIIYSLKKSSAKVTNGLVNMELNSINTFNYPDETKFCGILLGMGWQICIMSHSSVRNTSTMKSILKSTRFGPPRML